MPSTTAPIAGVSAFCRRGGAALNGSALFTGAMAVDDAALRQVVRRKLDVDAIAGKNSDAVAAEASCDVREDDVTVLQFYGERSARKDLLDAADDLERGLLDGLRLFDFGFAGALGATIAGCY